MRIDPPAGPVLSPEPALSPELARLKRTAQQFEGVFYDQLFKAMRETVPESGLFDAAPGQEMFQGLLDQQLSETAATRSRRGLGDAMFEQLRRLVAPVVHEAGAPDVRVARTDKQGG
jgi:Rod binding domain-containing protein